MWLKRLLPFVIATSLFTIPFLNEESSQQTSLDVEKLLLSANAQDFPGSRMFLKIVGIPGESMDEGHVGEIDIESFSWGETNPGVMSSGRGGGGGGKASFQDFHFVMKTNKASPKLFLAAAEGKHFPEGILTVRRAGGDQQEYLRWTFSDLLVSSYQTGGNQGNDVPTDRISLNFGKIHVEYQTQDGSTTEAGWDRKKNAPF